MKFRVIAFVFVILAGSAFAQYFYQPPEVAATAPNVEFPLHLHVFGNHWNYVRGAYDGWGHANLMGDKTLGVDYTYSCGTPFLHNSHHEEFYQARWKKEGSRLEILTQRVGSDKVHRCELKVTLKDTPYGRASTAPPNGEAPAQ
jgi:hypothetical protein